MSSVVFVVMLKTEEGKIAGDVVRGVSVKVRYLPSLHSHVPMQAKTDTTSPTAPHKHFGFEHSTAPSLGQRYHVMMRSRPLSTSKERSTRAQSPLGYHPREPHNRSAWFATEVASVLLRPITACPPPPAAPDSAPTAAPGSPHPTTRAATRTPPAPPHPTSRAPTATTSEPDCTDSSASAA